MLCASLCVFMWWQYECLYQTAKLQAIKRYSWNLNVHPQDSECYYLHLNLWVQE